MVLAQEDDGELVKENVVRGAPLLVWWVVLGALGTCGTLLAVERIDAALPASLARDAPAHRFIADIAHEHLVNLTSIGPRVAGSYENEVVAVSVLMRALQQMQEQVSPHNRIEIDLHTASGGFALSFFDGMNNAYRGVQSVVARVSAKGVDASRPSGRPRRALLLNCHFDTVPDSPGASDDGAGCAVVLETLRALAAARAPLRHDVVALFNGAEENIMQASHAFITQHKWARSVRAFINIEACGAGGREVLFQAGPHDPWIMEVYARAVPHPFASSLAQELFESGLIPADTDFRIFRDFGNLSGVDLAWSSNGYVYHTRLDTAARVPKGALQRTGDNVLALAHGLLTSEELELPVDPQSRQPVFFDVLGQWVVCARANKAALAAVAALLLVLLRVQLNARLARSELYMAPGAWWRAAAGALVALAVAHAVGLLAAAAVAATLHALNARLAFYAQPLLLAPLYALPAVCATWWTALALSARGGPLLRGWAAARAAHDAMALCWAGAVAACLLGRVRSGFWPLQWALLPALADLGAHASRAKGGARAWWWAAGALVPVLQTSYLALGCLHMFVPLTGRAGTPALPPDCMMALLSGALALAASSWMLPLVLVARHARVLLQCGLCACLASALLVALGPWYAPYSPTRPQRLMVFHTRRTLHAADAAPASETFYWLPDLDPNSPHSVDEYVPEMRSARVTGLAECSRWVYCGAPYYLPVLSLVGSGHALPAAQPPLAQAEAHLSAAPLGATTQLLTVNVTGPSHVVVVVSPVEGSRVAWSNVVASPISAGHWNGWPVYFFALHQARDRQLWHLQFHIEHAMARPPPVWAHVSVAGHAMAGAQKLHPAHAQLLQRLPAWVAATGWGVDMHLYSV